MIEHTTLLVSNCATAKEFYQKALAPLGYEMNIDMPKEKFAGYMEGGHTSFLIVEKENLVPTHVAFGASGPKAIDAFYEAAIAAGEKDNGKPGPRPDYAPGTYAAFVYDADGNNIEAVWFDPSIEKA